jgi:hypothetical protein
MTKMKEAAARNRRQPLFSQMSCLVTLADKTLLYPAIKRKQGIFTKIMERLGSEMMLDDKVNTRL